jgi:endonuclease-8
MIEKIESRGKWLLIYFSGDLILVTHMLMSGSWHLYRTGERWQMGRDRMRVVIRTVDWEAVAFNVPIAEFHTARSLERSEQIPKLGPDLLSSDFTVAGGTERLREFAVAHPDAEMGVVLLNQRVLAGLGNVYKSEVAFAAGVNPFRVMQTLTSKEMEAMVDVAQRYMKANVLDGSGDGIVTYSGNRRTTCANNREERLWVYGRQGEECRRCGTLVMMRKPGEQARSTYWCPECQPWVGAGQIDAPAPVGRTDIVRRRKIGC